MAVCLHLGMDNHNALVAAPKHALSPITTIVVSGGRIFLGERRECIPIMQEATTVEFKEVAEKAEEGAEKMTTGSSKPQ